MAVDKKTLALANKYTEETIKGEGAIKGKDGDSAYQVAVKNGFKGTEQEWLNSLKGDDSIGITELKMLGWTVPKECTIQNEINGNQFIQKVGRIDLGKLAWTYKAEDKRFWANLDSSKFIDNTSTIANIFCYPYKTTNYNTIITSEANKVVEQYQKAVSIKDTDYTTESDFKTAVTGVYLYYELATPITTHIDGNEIIKNNYSLSETIVGTWIDGKPIYRKVIETTWCRCIKQYER